MKFTSKPSNKGRKFPPEPLTSAEARALINACSKRAPTGIRNAALITILYRGGLRISEALSLKTKDIDFEAGSVRVLRGKGLKARTVGLDRGALALIERWLEKRAQCGLNGGEVVFTSLRGKPVSAEYVRAMLRRTAARAGIKKRVHPHGLRHTHAFELANEGTPIHLISAQLGHSNVGTTSQYIAHLNPREVIEAMRAREWNVCN